MSFLSRQAVTLTQVAAANSDISPKTVPRVAVFTGATAGIGRATLTNLVARGHPIRAYIIGRSASLASPFLGDLRVSNPSAELIFIEGQLSLLRDVKSIASAITARESIVDALFLCAGFLPFNGRMETDKGLEEALAVTFYSRILLMQLLMPLLRRATHPRVVSILGGGFETSAVDMDDIDCAVPGRFGVFALGRLMPTYTTLAMDRMAREEKLVVMIHHHPGSVATDIIASGLEGRWLARATNWLAQHFVRLVSFSAEQSGERSLYLLTSGRFGGWGTPAPEGENLDGQRDAGALFLVDMGLNCIRQEKVLGELEEVNAGERLWEHTRAVFKPYTG